MSGPAHVDSTDKLVRLREALARFAVDAQTALALADREIRRVFAILERKEEEWSRLLVKRRELMAQARHALAHARALHDGKAHGCIEQELELRKCQERVREAEEKVAVIRRRRRELPDLLKEFEGPARGLSGFVEADLRQAGVRLDGRIDALQAYAAVRSGKAGE